MKSFHKSMYCREFILFGLHVKKVIYDPLQFVYIIEPNKKDFWIIGATDYNQELTVFKGDT